MPTVVVAPREITDLVDRASRVAGCTADEAARIAADIAACEIDHGGALAAWLDLHARGALRAAAAAALTVESAALDAAAGAAARVTFADAVPYALLARALDALARRGIVPAEPLAAVSGGDPVESIELVGRGSADAFVCADSGAADDRRRAALERGIDVDRTEYERLEAVAACSLVAEADLDAADERAGRVG